MNPDRFAVPGLTRPLRLYFFADTHLQAHHPSDPLLPAAWRERPSPELPVGNLELLDSHLRRAVDGGADLILAGGDLFHFPSPENAALAAEAFRTCPVPVWSVPGNHDWFYPGQDGWEELRARQLPRLRDVFGDAPSHWRREIGGLRVLGFDNSTYFFSVEQTTFLISCLERAVPTLVMMHIPLSTPELREPVVAKHGSPILMADHEGRIRPGIDPAPTREAAGILRTSPHLVAVLAAHVHLPFVGHIAPGVPQLIPEAGYRHGYRWIELIPGHT